MKSTVRFCICAVLLVAGVRGAPAQGIVIDSATVAAMFAVGTTTTYRMDTLTTSANIGNVGASAWDFNGLTTHTRMSLRSVALATTPYYASHFPAATHALSDTAFTYSFYSADLSTTVTLRGAGYNYLKLGQDLLDYGFKGSGSAFLFGNPYPAEGQWVKSPAAVYYGLPLTMSKTWTTTYDETLSGSAQIFPSPSPPLAVGPTVTAHTVTYTVDAYGPLSVPGSAAEGALRIRKVDRYSSGGTEAVRVGYIFLTASGASVQFTAGDTSALSGTIPISSLQWTTPTATAIRTINDIPSAFALGQNYPNPFNPSTTIRFTLPSSQYVTLKVYNLLGEEVATLVDAMVDAGESSVQFDGARLSSGIYLYKLQSGASTQTRRMVFMK